MVADTGRGCVSTVLAAEAQRRGDLIFKLYVYLCAPMFLCGKKSYHRIFNTRLA